MIKITIFYLIALCLSLSGIACSGTITAVIPADNSTYTMEDILAIAQKHDPDCRKFAVISENVSPGG